MDIDLNISKTPQNTSQPPRWRPRLRQSTDRHPVRALLRIYASSHAIVDCTSTDLVKHLSATKRIMREALEMHTATDTYSAHPLEVPPHAKHLCLLIAPGQYLRVALYNQRRERHGFCRGRVSRPHPLADRIPIQTAIHHDDDGMRAYNRHFVDHRLLPRSQTADLKSTPRFASRSPTITPSSGSRLGAVCCVICDESRMYSSGRESR